ncbi:LCP family protein [Streptomyces pristinaespiralis]|uniref:Transcriptional regulator n=1 Tax=Streptomyces pristinaespiralis TaxID=38300 RepID=A0A0M4DAH9_STRPR|nr:LCP family protein [Streptomyces pristinaespiralis]ALC20838.1 transcriptional regulator [Streptomyces pristinaespiralis]QMU16354.1 LCP family protein [Streptomyces pristinaespiralis]
MSEQSSSGGRILRPGGVAGPPRGGRRRKRPTKARRTWTVVAWVAAALVLVGGSGLGLLYFKLNGNLQGVDIESALGEDRPKNVDNGSMDILVLGSDSRSGANSEYGDDDGAARSDTAMVVHVYQGHKSAGVVSVPRDTLVGRPECTGRDGTTVPGEKRAMFNSAYEVGGPACAVKTVEAMSGIRMDHYIEVDFTGFKKLIDELGGVDITTTRPIDDSKSHLSLAPGTHSLDGEQALGLVRTRKSVGDGSDLGRIQLQQAFMKAFIDQVKDVGVFSSPKKLLDLADAGTKAITPDSGLDSVNELMGFARGLSSLGAEDVDMITMPVEYDPADPNRVVPVETGARQVWTALKQDRPIPASAVRDSAGDKGDAATVVKSP